MGHETAVMFSGGTDSTLTAALVAQKYQKVHLVSYDRFDLFAVKNTQLNAQKLQHKYGHDRFEHHIIKINKITRYVFYERYLRNLKRHGFFLLSICGLCKLAMHIRTVIFCVENHISDICDGANQGMHLFPAQMAIVIDEVQKMYARFGITYSNPVFNFEGPQETGFADRLNLELSVQDKSAPAPEETPTMNTTGRKLHELGLMPSDNVKGTALDRKMQPRCFQFILFNIFLKWYYLYDHSLEEYQAATLNLYKDKMEHLSADIEAYLKNKTKSKLHKMIER